MDGGGSGWNGVGEEREQVLDLGVEGGRAEEESVRCAWRSGVYGGGALGDGRSPQG